MNMFKELVDKLVYMQEDLMYLDIVNKLKKIEEIEQLNERWKFQNRFWRNEE